jgi:hypothetical protein
MVFDKGMLLKNKNPNVDTRYFIRTSGPDIIVWRLKTYLPLEEFDPHWLNNINRLKVYDSVKNGDYLIVMNIGAKIEWLEMYSLQRKIEQIDNIEDIEIIDVGAV